MAKDIRDEYLSNEEDTERQRQADTYGFVPPRATGYCQRRVFHTNCGQPTRNGSRLCDACWEEIERNAPEVPF